MHGENLVFLICLPRSGSTLLSMMLSAHTQIACPPEPWILLFAAEILNFSEVRSAPYGRNIAQIAALDFLYSMENEKAGTVENIIINIGKKICDKENLNEIIREFVRNAYNAHISLCKKRIFIDKTPSFIYRLFNLIL